MGSRDYRQLFSGRNMDQKIGIELEDGMGLRVDFFFNGRNHSACMCAGWNDPEEAKQMM